MSNSSGEPAAVEASMYGPDARMANGGDSRQQRAGLIDAWWPVVMGVGVIALESTPWGGADHTSGPLRAIYQFFFGPISAAHWEPIHHLIRKSGHFLGYGFLCLTWLRAWRLTFPGFRYFKDAALALLGTAIVASSDELHQHFLKNRGSSPWDVLLDCIGAATMTLLAWVVLRIFRPGMLRENS